MELAGGPPVERPAEQLGVEVRHRLRIGAGEVDEDHRVHAVGHGATVRQTDEDDEADHRQRRRRHDEPVARGARSAARCSSSTAIIAAVGSTSELLRRHPDAAVVDATGCVVTPGMINAHQHLTGDPLVRSCVPDLLAAGRVDLRVVGAAARRAHARRRRDVGDAVRRRVRPERRDHGGRGRHRRPSRPRGRRRCRRSASAARSARGDGTSRSARSRRPVDEVLDRQRAVVERYPAGGLVEGGSRSSATTWRPTSCSSARPTWPGARGRT